MHQDSLFSALPKQPSFKPQEPILREAIVEDGCRFLLKRAWGGGPCVLWAMCNPSNADADKDDPTMLRVMEFSSRWGFGSCVVINPIPLISSTPKEALDWIDAVGRMTYTLGEKVFEQWNTNMATCVEQILAAEMRVAAWGNIMPLQFVKDWWQCVVENTPDEPGPEIFWHCLGTNKDGSPKHPLARGKNRVPADFKPIRWEQKL